MNDGADSAATANDLWEAAKTLRKKPALVWLLFYKRTCDLWEEGCAARAALARSGAVAPSPSRGGFVIPGHCSWSDIRAGAQDAGGKLAAAFHAIEEGNPALAGLLSRLDFSDREMFPDSDLNPLMASFDSLRLRASDMDDDGFGSLCDELTERIASDERATTGRPGTPRQIARLLVGILQPEEGMSIYDGACGSGGMLLECFRHVKRLKKNAASLRFYGQEIDSDAWALCRINMLCHGIDNAVIDTGDTLRSPMHLTGDGRALMSFDRVISHPPFNRKEWGFDEWSRGDAYGRSGYGVPPRSSADLAFLEHSISSMNDKGMLGTVAPQGVLFRTREEGEIRRRIVQDDLVEAVVSMAPDVLFPFPMPACLLVLNKAKPRERRERILFVNGEELLAGASRSILPDQNVDRIASAFHSFEDREQLCRVVSLREIERNDFALSVSRYVQMRTREPETDLAAEWQALLRLISERNEAEEKVAEHIHRLEKISDDS